MQVLVALILLIPIGLMIFSRKFNPINKQIKKVLENETKRRSKSKIS